jgi:hypothetical protein
MVKVVIRPMGKTSDEITGKAGNEMRQVRTHTWAPGVTKVTEEVMHHASMWVDGALHLCLHVCKVIHPMLESSDPFHRMLSLVNPITDVPLQRSVPVRVPSKGGGSSSEASLGVTVRGVVTTSLMVTQVATPGPSVLLGLLRVSLWSSRGLLCCLHARLPASVRWSYEVVVCLSHPIKLQCNTFTRVQSKAQGR